MSVKPALDAAAQCTLIAWTMREILNPDDVAPLLRRVLSLSGIRDIQVLKKRKQRGLSVRGVTPAYPRGSVRDVELISKDLQAIAFPEITASRAIAITGGPDWEMPTADSAASLTIDEI